LQLFNGEHATEEEFETQKQKALEAYGKFISIQRQLSMPGAEILMFINEDITKKIKEIVDLNVENLTIDPDATIIENGEKVKQYLTILGELAELLQKDLKVEWARRK